MRLENDLKTNYLLSNFGKATELHRKVEAHSQAEGVLGMQISAYEGQMLQLFSSLIGAKKIVEIGCLFGYSALWFLEALPADGTLYLLELNEDRVAWMQDNLKTHPKFSQIQWFTGDALKNLEKLNAQGPFDLCFIDANKAAYCDYLNWAEESVRTGGLILGDNSFLWGGVYENNNEKSSQNQVWAMREFNQRLSDKERYLSSLIPTEEGLTVAQKLF